MEELLFSSPGDLPNPGIKPGLLHFRLILYCLSYQGILWLQCVHQDIWMWELDHKGGWVRKNWCFQIVVLEKTLESPLGSKEIKPINPKGNQLSIFVGITDVETPILGPSDMKSQLIGKDTDVGKDWGQEEMGHQRMRRLDGITDSMDMSLSQLWETV